MPFLGDDFDFRRMPVVIGSSSSEWRPRRPPQIDSCIILPIQKAIKRAMPRNKQYKYPSRFLEMGKNSESNKMRPAFRKTYILSASILQIRDGPLGHLS